MFKTTPALTAGLFHTLGYWILPRDDNDKGKDDIRPFDKSRRGFTFDINTERWMVDDEDRYHELVRKKCLSFIQLESALVRSSN